MQTTLSFIATCPRGTEAVLRDELAALGAQHAEASFRSVTFEGTLEAGYRACLWSRVASRILLRLGRVPAEHADALFEGVYGLPWEEHVDPGRTFAVHCVGRSEAIRNTRYGALRVKDAVVDRLRETRGRRPDVDAKRPDARVHVHLEGAEATVGLDLSGDALHRRGYRPRHARAPVKENLAAAVLQLAQWPRWAEQGAPLMDPLCGSATFVVEAAWMATDVAPGLHRARFGLEAWPGHDAACWQRLRDEARQRQKQGAQRTVSIFGFDVSDEALRAAHESVRRAGAQAHVQLERRALEDVEAPSDAAGLLVTNPPYGQRLGAGGAPAAGETELIPLYQRLGDVLRHRFGGWTAHVLVGSKALAKRIGLRPTARHVLFNGPIECRLLVLPIATDPPRRSGPQWRRPSEQAPMFENRLRKNHRKLAPWARRQDIDCYRVYDADIPEYNVAVDLYGDAVHVQEYEPPARVDPEQAARRLQDVMLVVPQVLEVDPDAVCLKVRRRHPAGGQYGRMGARGIRRTVREQGHRFAVNLSDYLDTGLFLEQRRIRREIAELSAGRRFLNLFAYTCTATVYAACAGAAVSTSVDLSNTYLGWARENFELNGVDAARHELERADCVAWLRRESRCYDVIYLAPPSFSRSKGMQRELDLRRDAHQLVRSAAERLTPSGVLLFLSPARDIELVPRQLQGLAAQEVTERTTPRDFARSKPQRCWRITRA